MRLASSVVGLAFAIVAACSLDFDPTLLDRDPGVIADGGDAGDADGGAKLDAEPPIVEYPDCNRVDKPRVFECQELQTTKSCKPIFETGVFAPVLDGTGPLEGLALEASGNLPEKRTTGLQFPKTTPQDGGFGRASTVAFPDGVAACARWTMNASSSGTNREMFEIGLRGGSVVLGIGARVGELRIATAPLSSPSLVSVSFPELKDVRGEMLGIVYVRGDTAYAEVRILSSGATQTLRAALPAGGSLGGKASLVAFEIENTLTVTELFVGTPLAKFADVLRNPKH